MPARRPHQRAFRVVSFAATITHDETCLEDHHTAINSGCRKDCFIVPPSWGTVGGQGSPKGEGVDTGKIVGHMLKYAVSKVSSQTANYMQPKCRFGERGVTKGGGSLTVDGAGPST